jgi:cob(I)alamin adenosyltransferase
MVRLTRIYTRGGDAGETSLGDGTRLKKHALRVEAYGTVDETNAAVGLARLHASGDTDAMLGRIQNDLFDLGADLSTPEDGRRGANALRIVAAQVERLEHEIDAMNEELRPLDDGTYGSCARCGNEIPEERLAAVPYAVLCLSCKQIEEHA